MLGKSQPLLVLGSVIETPLVRRRADTIDHAWLRVGVNGFLWDNAMWGFEHMDSNRKIVEPIKWRTNGSHILILMQNANSTYFLRVMECRNNQYFRVVYI